MYTIVKHGRLYSIYYNGINTGAMQRTKKNILHAYKSMTGINYNGSVIVK